MAACGCARAARWGARLVPFLVAMASIAAVVDGSALPVNTISSLALGWGVAAGVHAESESPNATAMIARTTAERSTAPAVKIHALRIGCFDIPRIMEVSPGRPRLVITPDG
jgi:hypothetical protein